MRQITEKDRADALAFRVWQIANDAEWNLTSAEIAEKLEISAKTVGQIVRYRGWGNRLRVTRRDKLFDEPSGLTYVIDSQLEAFQVGGM